MVKDQIYLPMVTNTMVIIGMASHLGKESIPGLMEASIKVSLKTDSSMERENGKSCYKQIPIKSLQEQKYHRLKHCKTIFSTKVSI